MTREKKEIERFIEGAVEYALSERHDSGICWCNHCRTGGGSLRLGGIDHQRFMENEGLWEDENPTNPLNRMGLGKLTQNVPNPKEDAAEIVRQAIVLQGADYQTGTGKGTYELSPVARTLVFDGFRGSFCGGCEVFCATREGGWELLESTKPEWGVWGSDYRPSS